MLTTSRAGSSSRISGSGSPPARMPAHSGSSSSRAGSDARSVSRRDQRRNDVSTGGRAAGRPAEMLSQAVARSGSRTRQETPSIDRWCTISSSRPGADLAASNHTAWSMTPASGSSRSRAASAAAEIALVSASPVRTPPGPLVRMSTRSSSVATSTASGGGTVNVQWSPFGPDVRTRRARSMSCRSTSACRMASRVVQSSSAGVCTSADW